MIWTSKGFNKLDYRCIEFNFGLVFTPEFLTHFSTTSCWCYAGGAESDMELDLLGESESDSDESIHSHADNASIQRSAVTAATAGSDAGLLHSLSCCPAGFGTFFLMLSLPSGTLSSAVLFKTSSLLSNCCPSVLDTVGWVI